MHRLYIAIEKKDYFTDKLYDIESFVSEIKLWMKRNMFNLYDDKTEYCIVLKSEQILHRDKNYAARMI